MIKGINRQIIEVGETGNLYFEKAFLFVRPQLEEVDDQRLKNEANRMVERLGVPPKLSKTLTKKNKSSILFKIGYAFFWSVFGAGVFAFIQRLFF